MAFQQSDLDQLDAAMASGVKKVTFADGRSTEYQTLADMRGARKDIKAELAAASSQVARRTRRLIVGRVGRCR